MRYNIKNHDYNNIQICPSINKVFKKGIKYIKNNLLLKGINITNKSIELVIIIYKNLNINIDKFPKFIGFIEIFLRKFGKIIFR